MNRNVVLLTTLLAFTSPNTTGAGLNTKPNALEIILDAERAEKLPIGLLASVCYQESRLKIDAFNKFDNGTGT